MTAEEYLKTKGWAQDNPIIGGALWSAMVEMLEEYHQAKLKSLLNLDAKPITSRKVKTKHLLLGVVEIESLIDFYKKDLKEVEVEYFQIFSVFIRQLEQIDKKLKDSVSEDMKKWLDDNTQ